MQLTSWFQASVCGMAALAGILLAVAEGKPSPEIISPLLAVISFLYTDRRGRLVLSPLWANACGFLAICLAVAEFFSGIPESRLLAGAHLLVYATWIVFFQRKTVALYWWLCALCLLQVAVGAVLMNRSGSYGFLTVLYFFVAVWTLSLFSLYQARERLLAAADSGRGSPRPLENGSRQFHLSRRWEPAWAGAGGLTAAAAQLRAGSTAQGSIQLDSQARWLRLRFVAGTLCWGLASLCVGGMFFALTPRLWIGSGQRFANVDELEGRRLAVTGFADKVQLGQFGTVLTSTEPVFRVRFVDEQTGDSIAADRYAARLGMDEPLFRGAVLSRYLPSAQRWESAGFERRIDVPSLATGDVVRQEFHLEPIETDVLFAMHPVRACRIYSRRRPLAAIQDQQTARLFASREHSAGARYNVYSPAAPSSEADLVTGGQSPPRRYDRSPTPELGELTKLAREVAGYRDANAHPPAAEMARRLLAWLRDSGRFEYSLDTTAVNPASDPIEDFLLRRRRGHCEYFASSLTLMLRAVDVPARLVSGFKGGEPLDGDEWLQVQRRHAHAWVEAWYDGRWHVLDPTPAAGRLASVEEMGPSLGSLGSLWTAVSRWWSEFVVGMDLSQQRRNLYEPLQRGLQDLWKSLQGDRRAGNSLLASIRGFLSSPRRWISWQGGLVTFVLLLVVSGLWWLARRGWRALRHLWSRMRTAVVHRGRQVEFYERFRRLCERQGLVRRPGQTQLEFADHVRGRLQPRLAAAGIGGFPTRLVELFYQVRFGEQPLPPDVSEELDRRLTEMERCLVPAATAPNAMSPVERATFARPAQRPDAAPDESADGLSAGTNYGPRS